MAWLDEFLTVGFNCLICSKYFEIKSYSFNFLAGIALNCPHCGEELFVFDNFNGSILIASGPLGSFN